MDSAHDDVFKRLNTAIDEWNSQITDSHDQLANQIAAAQNHLNRLLHPQRLDPSTPVRPPCRHRTNG